MFPEPLNQRERNQFGFEVNDLPCAAGGTAAASRKLFMGRNVGKERFRRRPLKTSAHPEHRLTVAWNQQQPVLHRAGEMY